jgi:outer membrane protein assembly factor BamD (BamD/ComL family)
MFSAFVLATLTGCQMDFGRLTGNPDKPFWDVESISSPMGANSLALLGRDDEKSRRRQQLLMSGQGEKELEEAIEQYENGNKGSAVRKFVSIAKRYNETATGEEAQFRYASAMYESNVFAKAQDGYSKLLTEYPSTRYMDDATKRLFRISRYWLDLAGARPSSEILQASFEEETPDTKPDRSKDPTTRVPLLPNIFDKSRPVFDTKGRALQALRTIWLSDPTGDLADDALMMTASHYLNKGDYVEADRFFKILRDEYPRSPHLEDAFVLGSHVKLMSYQGALYDGTPLSDAEQLKEKTLRMFPDNKNREKLKSELKAVTEAAAQRDWEMVEYYRKKNKPRAMAVYCEQVIQNHPNSSYAELAHSQLQRISPEKIKNLPLTVDLNQPEPAANRPYEE